MLQNAKLCIFTEPLFSQSKCISSVVIRIKPVFYFSSSSSERKQTHFLAFTSLKDSTRMFSRNLPKPSGKLIKCVGLLSEHGVDVCCWLPYKNKVECTSWFTHMDLIWSKLTSMHIVTMSHSSANTFHYSKNSLLKNVNMKNLYLVAVIVVHI